MIEFKRDKQTGNLFAYKKNKKIGRIITMGDNVKLSQKGKKHGEQKHRKVDI